MHTQIIFLNGPSSAGKSSVARLLQQQLPGAFLHLGIDHFIAMMPARVNDWDGKGGPLEGFRFRSSSDAAGNPRRELEVGPVGRRLAASYVEVVALLARRGHQLLVDEVTAGELTIDDWKRALAPYPTLWVGITAPLANLEAREVARGDRPRGSARVQAERISFAAGYDLVLNTEELVIAAAAEQIVRFCMSPPAEPPSRP